MTNVFIIDISSCTGCHACRIACKDRASGLLRRETGAATDDKKIPDFIRIEEHTKGTFPDLEFFYRMSHCFHCERASCIPACPAGAITKTDGFLTISTSSCTGCGICVETCPFSAIALDSQGSARTCDGCADELASGREPVCVRACPLRALRYGSSILPTDRMLDPSFADKGNAPAVLYVRRKRPE